MTEEQEDDAAPQRSANDPTSESAAWKIAFFAGISAFSIFGGFGINLATLAARRDRDGIGPKRYEDPIRFASRALAWGTAYAVGGVGAFALLAGCVWKM